MFKRINWGTAVVLSFIAFGTFIGVLVFKIQTDQRYEHSLVIEDYYKQEQNLSAKLQALRNGEPWKRCLTTEKTETSFVFKGCKFESISTPIKINGYRPNDDTKDFKIVTQVREGMILIDKKYLSIGNWIITLEWEEEKTRFLVEQKILF